MALNLPDHVQLGDTGHIDDTNLIIDALAELETLVGQVGEGPPGPPYSFPPGQVGQVWTVLPNGTMGWAAPAGAVLLPPSASFSLSDASVQQGGSVTLTDGSTGSPASWTWTITGGATRTGQGPHVVMFPNVGTFTVTLTVANAAGNSVVSHDVTVTATPPVLTPANVIFTTTGATFSPRIELVPPSQAIVTWYDDQNAVIATGLQPTFNFGSAASRQVRMNVADRTVIRTINIGFTNGDDWSQYQPPSTYNHPAQQVSGITGLTGLSGMVNFMAANGPLAGLLDFTGCSSLQAIECFGSYVQSVNLAGCSSLVRYCMEGNHFDPAIPIDLNPVAATLRDFRSANMKPGSGLRFATLTQDMPLMYHWCIVAMATINHPDTARFTGCVEFWAYGSTNTTPASGGALNNSAGPAYDWRAGAGWTSYSDAGRVNTNSAGSIDCNNAGLTTVSLRANSHYRGLNFSGNPGLTTSTVDHILTTANSWGTSNGTINLTGCGQPSAAAPAVIAALRARGWTVTTETPLAGAPPAPTAGFTVTPASPQATVPATFTSTSTYGESWAWNFGADATPATASTVGPHSVTYAIAGVKTATLTVSNATGSDPETQNITVQAAPSGGDLFTDYFNRVAANIAAMGSGWNAAGGGVTASTDGNDLLYVVSGQFGRLATPTTVSLPANYGIEVVAPRASWSAMYNGIFLRYSTGDSSGVKLFTIDGSTWIIGDTRSWDWGNGDLTMVGGFPAGWTGAGDHTVRLEVTGQRADVYADGQHVGYRDSLGSGSNAGMTGTSVGFCGDTQGNPRVWRSIRVYPLA